MKDSVAMLGCFWCRLAVD